MGTWTNRPQEKLLTIQEKHRYVSFAQDTSNRVSALVRAYDGVDNKYVIHSTKSSGRGRLLISNGLLKRVKCGAFSYTANQAIHGDIKVLVIFHDLLDTKEDEMEVYEAINEERDVDKLILVVFTCQSLDVTCE